MWPLGGLQPLHLLVILAIALIIFGPSRLPELGKALGKSIREFRDAASAAQEEVKKGLEEPDPKKTTVEKTEGEAKPQSAADLPKS